MASYGGGSKMAGLGVHGAQVNPILTQNFSFIEKRVHVPITNVSWRNKNNVL